MSMAYRLLFSPSTKLKLKDNHYITPCISFEKEYKIVKTIKKNNFANEKIYKLWL